MQRFKDPLTIIPSMTKLGNLYNKDMGILRSFVAKTIKKKAAEALSKRLIKLSSFLKRSQLGGETKEIDLFIEKLSQIV